MDGDIVSIVIVSIIVLAVISFGLGSIIEGLVPPTAEWYKIIADDEIYTCRWFDISGKGATINLHDCNNESNTVSISNYMTISIEFLGDK